MIPLSSSISAENTPFEIQSFLIPRFSSGRLLFLECATRWWTGRGVAFLYCWQRGRQLIWMRMADKRIQTAACSLPLEGQWPMKWHRGQWVGPVSHAEFPVFQWRDVPPIHPSAETLTDEVTQGHCETLGVLLCLWRITLLSQWNGPRCFCLKAWRTHSLSPEAGRSLCKLNE